MKRWQIENLEASRYVPGPSLEKELRKRRYLKLLKITGITLGALFGLTLFMAVTSWQAGMIVTVALILYFSLRPDN